MEKGSSVAGVEIEPLKHALHNAGIKAYFWRETVGEWPNPRDVADLFWLSPRLERLRINIFKINRILSSAEHYSDKISDRRFQYFARSFEDLTKLIGEAKKTLESK